MSAATIYFDNNATTAIDPRVADVIDRVLRAGPANASSQHAVGRLARQRVDESLEIIGTALGTDLGRPAGPRLILTSGGTESNHMALFGIGDLQQPLVVSNIEHPSVLATAKYQQSLGREVRWLPVDGDGVIQIDALASMIEPPGKPRATLVSLMSANNETGVIQPIQQAAKICREANVPLHVDATQSIGKVPFPLDRLDAAAVTFTAHKLHGPVGIGGLWLRAGLNIRPVFHGGSQQLESRPGTEPVALIAGMAAAIRLAVQELDSAARLMCGLRDQLEQSLLARHPQLVVIGQQVPRLPSTTSIALIGTERQSMLMALDMAGIACSSGAACSSGSSPPSHVLVAMNAPSSWVESTLRFGVSKFSTVDENIVAVERISNAYSRLRNLDDVEN